MYDAGCRAQAQGLSNVFSMGYKFLNSGQLLAAALDFPHDDRGHATQKKGAVIQPGSPSTMAGT